MKYFRCGNCRDAILDNRVLSRWWPCWTKAKDKKKCDERLCTKCARDSRYCKTCRAEKALTEDPPETNPNVAFGHQALQANTTGSKNCAFGVDALMRTVDGVQLFSEEQP